MSAAKITDTEGGLLNVLGKLGVIEWRKYQQRYPKVWDGMSYSRENRTSYPPFVSFRFVSEGEVSMCALAKVVSEYKGKVEWVLVGRKRDGLPGINWTIGPARMFEICYKACKVDMSVSQYLAEYDPEFSRAAYEDFGGLEEYIKKSLLSDI